MKIRTVQFLRHQKLYTAVSTIAFSLVAGSAFAGLDWAMIGRGASGKHPGPSAPCTTKPVATQSHPRGHRICAATKPVAEEKTVTAHGH